MKTLKLIFCLLGFVFFIIAGKAQDSTYNKLSKSSISFTGGINVIYPSIKQYREVKSSNYYYSDYTISPSTSAAPWFLLSYNYLIHQSQTSFIRLNFGIGYAQYKFSGIANGYSIASNYNTRIEDSGTSPAGQKMDEFEINAGIYTDIKIYKKLYWHNEVNVVNSYTFYSYFNSVFYGDTKYIYSLYLLSDLPSEKIVNIYFNYLTGITFQINKNLAITPEVGFILLSFPVNMTPFFLFNNNYYLTINNNNQVNPYNTIQAGFKFTYNFNGKK